MISPAAYSFIPPKPAVPKMLTPMQHTTRWYCTAWHLCRLETPDIGDLLSLVLNHNNKGKSPSWFLHGVELAHIAKGIQYTWRAATWLDAQSGCSRTFKAAQAQQGSLNPQRQQHSSCSYQLEVQTSSIEGAGTSANVFVQLGGVLCEADAVQLQPAGAGIVDEAAPRYGSSKAGLHTHMDQACYWSDSSLCCYMSWDLAARQFVLPLQCSGCEGWSAAHGTVVTAKSRSNNVHPIMSAPLAWWCLDQADVPEQVP